MQERASVYETSAGLSEPSLAAPTAFHTSSPNKHSTIAPLCGHLIHANVRHPFHYYSVIIVCDV